MSKIVRLTEAQLNNIIKRTVKKVIKESAGNIYGSFDDGTKFTNAKDTYRGVPGTIFIWHGEWSDPEIWYKGCELNANDVEDGLWSMYKEDCEEEGLKPSDDGFDEWCESNRSLIESELDDIIWTMGEC